MYMEYVGFGIAIVAALVFGYLVGRITRKKKEEELLAAAKREVELLKEKSLLDGRRKIRALQEKLEKRARRKQKELEKMEERVLEREDRLGKKSNYLERVEDSLRSDEEELKQLKEEGASLLTAGKARLEQIAGWSQQQAREHLLGIIESESQQYFSRKLEQLENKAKEEAEQRAATVIATAVQRYAAEYVEDNMTSSVSLPSEEFKGRIIGREGRNIRTFEALAGVELLVDDTPETVILSCFHPMRREVARMALERLIEDGRIHPAQIEEKVRRAKARLAEKVKTVGRKAAFDVGVDLHPELVALLGRLRYRTSYGQNQLSHSLETSWIAKLLATELKIDPETAKRAGLLHDIGKAIDHEVDGPHALIGADLVRRYGEKPEVVHAIAAHHEDVPTEGILDVLLQAADTLSAARPGARQETFERYIQRLQELEDLCRSFPAVKEAYALQAGREVRVMVKPNRASDDIAAKLAFDIARAIEGELSYPGEIKVNVIRKTQFTQSAK